MAQIFLSYARADRERIQPLLRVLTEGGWTVFWDHQIQAGADWRSEIERHLKAAKAVVVVWSHSSIESKWVLEEAEEARVRGILLPVLLDEVKPPLGFRSIQCRTLRGWKGGNSAPEIESLLAGIRSTAGSPLLPPRTRRHQQRAKQDDAPVHSPPTELGHRMVAGATCAALGLALGFLMTKLARVEFHYALSLFTALGGGIAGALCGEQRAKLVQSVLVALVSWVAFWGICRVNGLPATFEPLLGMVDGRFGQGSYSLDLAEHHGGALGFALGALVVVPVALVLGAALPVQRVAAWLLRVHQSSRRPSWYELTPQGKVKSLQRGVVPGLAFGAAVALLGSGDFNVVLSVVPALAGAATVVLCWARRVRLVWSLAIAITAWVTFWNICVDDAVPRLFEPLLVFGNRAFRVESWAYDHRGAAGFTLGGLFVAPLALVLAAAAPGSERALRALRVLWPAMPSQD